MHPNDSLPLHLEKGQRHLDAQNWTAAQAALEAALQLEPQSEAARTGLVRAYNGAGVQHFGAGNVAAALEQFSAARALAPKAIDVLLNVFDAQVALGDGDGAERTIEAALEHGRGVPDVLVSAARLALALGDEAAAQSYLDELRGVAPDHPALAPAAEAVVPGLVSIVIATVTLDYLEACLASIEKHTTDYPNYEIIVVNDGSAEPGLRAFLEAMPHQALHLPENVGFARANNAGFNVARGQYVMTMNADTLVHPGWLGALVATLEQDATIGAVAPTVLDMGTDVIQSGGSDWDDANFRKYVTRYIGQRRVDVPEIETAYPVDGLVGVCVLFRREALFGVGGFDEEYLNGWEDMDLSVALLQAGWQLYHAPGVIEHKGSFVRNTFTPQHYQELIARNRARFLAKWDGVTVRHGRFLASVTGDGQAAALPVLVDPTPDTEITPETPPRVCIVTRDFVGPIRNGGIGTAYTAIAETLVAAGHDVTVLFVVSMLKIEQGTLDEWTRYYAARGIRFIALPEDTETRYTCHVYLQHGHQVYRWLKAREGAFDVIHFHEWMGYGASVVRAKKMGLAFARTRIVVGLHSPHAWQLEGNRMHTSDATDLALDHLERVATEGADVVWSPSVYLMDWVQEQGWKLPEQREIYRYLMPESARATAPSRARRLVNEIVFFGRLEMRKGLALFCDALDRLVREGVGVPAVTFLGKVGAVMGGNGDAYIEDRARAWPFPVRVLTDYGQPEAMAYLQAEGRLAVMPSLMDNAPFAVLECAHLGVPFLASNAGGIPEIVAEEDADVCFELTPMALASAVQHALADGVRSARPSIAPEANVQRWVAWHEALATDARAEAPFGEPVEWPFISVCMTTFNRPSTLQQALASLREQEYPHFEVVLVDDGSTKAEAVAYLETLEPEFERRGWQLIRQQNTYLGQARNNAAARARGSYVMFMDDDNIAKPFELRTYARAAAFSGADVLTCVMDHFEGEAPPEGAAKTRWMAPGGPAAGGALENCYGDANALVRREVIDATGGFTTDRNLSMEDWEFFGRAVMAGFRLEVVPEPLFWYRVDATSVSRVTDQYLNDLRGLRPYHEAAPEALKPLVRYAQGACRKLHALSTTLRHQRAYYEQELDMAQKIIDTLQERVKAAAPRLSEAELLVESAAAMLNAGDTRTALVLLRQGVKVARRRGDVDLASDIQKRLDRVAQLKPARA